MKIITIIGSPKGKGNTFEAAKKVEESLRKIDDKIEFEYIILKNVNLQPCSGCYICFHKGEDLCPLKDDRALIEQKMLEADGVIFASPVYAFNITWIMKNFIDRFAYVCHRPRFHGKSAMVISTTGAVGLGFTLFTLGFGVSTWGFSIASKLGVLYPAEKILEQQERKLNKRIKENTDTAALKFYKALNKNESPKPSIVSVLSFKLQKDAFARKDHDLADYKYWRDKGWLDKQTAFYYHVKINIVKRAFTGIVARIITSMDPKPLMVTKDVSAD